MDGWSALLLHFRPLNSAGLRFRMIAGQIEFLEVFRRVPARTLPASVLSSYLASGRIAVRLGRVLSA